MAMANHDQVTADLEQKWMDEDLAAEEARERAQEARAWNAYLETLRAEGITHTFEGTPAPERELEAGG
jgi:hypothetical protein